MTVITLRWETEQTPMYRIAFMFGAAEAHHTRVRWLDDRTCTVEGRTHQVRAMFASLGLDMP